MLTDTEIKKLKPAIKDYKKSDSGGLFLLVKPDGKKYWRFKYTFEGREQLISLGVYPYISLATARAKREENKTLIANGVNPSALRKIQKAETDKKSKNTFQTVALEWFAKYQSSWVPAHAKKILALLNNDIIPRLGKKPISAISAPELLKVVRVIESRGAIDTAHRALSVCGRVFKYGIATGRAERDISADLRGALEPIKSQNFAAVTDPSKLADVLIAFDNYTGSFVVRCALQLIPLLFVRHMELRNAKWADIDFNTSEWRYLVTKSDRNHIVPLSAQAVSILKELHQLTGENEYVFSGLRGKTRPISENTLSVALRQMGFSKEDLSIHGFRATARTLLAEELGFRAELIEHQLAHKVIEATGYAYNRTTFIAERHAMMQAWADYLDKIKANS